MDRFQPYWTAFLKGWSQVLPVFDRFADWADRLDWDSLGPPVCMGAAVMLIGVLLLYSLDASDKRTIEFWSAFAVAGRWVALGAAVTPVVVWAATRR